MLNLPNKTYVTKQGDTWDIISNKFYNTPFYISTLVKQNPQHSKVLVFNAGVSLNIPEIEVKTPETLPPWKRGV